MKALIVDDSKAIRMILGKILKGMGFEVAEGDNGKSALAVLAARGAFDIAFVDWNMPEMDGFELLQAIRADRKLDGMKVMMATTETEVERVTRALEAGANEYLMKPFNAEAIAQKLEILGLKVAA